MDPILGINTFGCNTTDQNHRIKNCQTNTMNQPWKCVKFSLHERNFSLHESAWTFLFMKGTFLCMKVHELFSTWKKLFSAWKCVNLKITLLHYNLSSVWFAIKDNTCLIMPTISPFGLDGKANLRTVIWFLWVVWNPMHSVTSDISSVDSSRYI